MPNDLTNIKIRDLFSESFLLKNETEDNKNLLNKSILDDFSTLSFEDMSYLLSFVLNGEMYSTFTGSNLPDISEKYTIFLSSISTALTKNSFTEIQKNSIYFFISAVLNIFSLISDTLPKTFKCMAYLIQNIDGNELLNSYDSDILEINKNYSKNIVNFLNSIDCSQGYKPF